MSDESNSSWTQASISAYFVLFSFLLAAVLILSKLLHDHKVAAALVPEAGMIVLVGLVAGSFINLFIPKKLIRHDNDDSNDGSVAETLLSFNPEIFFIALLPPIIFNSGYHIRRELFFRHIAPILLFAIAGTIISALSIAAILELVTRLGWTSGFEPTLTELLTFGALISATDTVSTLAVFQVKKVDPHLFYLVFGESALNDAVGLVLFKAFATFVARHNGAEEVAFGVASFFVEFFLDALLSPVIGLVCGCGAAYLLKRIDMRKTKILELSLYVLIMYVPFLLAEMVELSGIVTILFTGMAANAYCVPNLSPQSAKSANVLFRLFAHLAETAIFLELGLSVYGLTGSLNIVFVGWTVLACLVGRALNVYPLTYIYNQSLKILPAVETAPTNEDDEINHEKKNAHVEMTNLDSKTEYQTTANNDVAAAAPVDHDNADPTLIRRTDSLTSTYTHTPYTLRDLRIDRKTSHMLWFSGLRGAVAYACVRSFPDTLGHDREFMMTTMAVVLLTVFGIGSTTELMLSKLDIVRNVDEDQYMEEWRRQRSSANWLLRIEDWVQRHCVRNYEETSSFKKLHHKIDDDNVDCDDDRRASSMALYTSHVEVTASQFIRDTDADGLDQRKVKRKSVYDYGGGNEDSDE